MTPSKAIKALKRRREWLEKEIDRLASRDSGGGLGFMRAEKEALRMAISLMMGEQPTAAAPTPAKPGPTA